MTDNNIRPENEGTVPEANESAQEKGTQFSKRTMAIIAAVALALSVGGYFFFTSGGDESDPGAPTTAPTSVGTTAAPPVPSASASPTVVAEAETTLDPTVTSENAPAEGEEGALNPEGEAEGHGPNPYDENGTEYIMTEASQKEWRPIRAKFISGLIGDGNIAEAVQGTATEEVMKSLENQPPGAFKDAIPEQLGVHDQFDEKVTSYEYTEAIRMESGKWLYVTVVSVNDGGKDAFLVGGYKIVDGGNEEVHDPADEEGAGD